MFKRVMASVTALIFVATMSFAQTPTPQAATGEENISMSAEGYVSLDFREADIRNVFKILSFKSGVNIVAGPEVTGTVSIQLNNVPWKQALDVILQTYGYAYEQRGNIIIVTTVENLKKRREDAMVLAEQEPVETRTYTLNFGKASEIIASLEKMKSDRGSIDFDERTNTLIITDSTSKLDLMATVVETLDSTTPQVLIEAKIVETQFNDEENLGIDWIVQASARGALRPTTYPFTNHSSNKYLVDDFVEPEDEDFTFGTLDFNQFQVVLEMLKTRSNTEILSSPRIVTVDNQTASITVGSQYPIPTYTYNEEQARLQVSGWEYMDIGIIFDVTPHVNDAGFVTIDVQPKITAILDFVTVENTSLPRLSNESAKTSVMVKDGDTLVIGGLVKTQTTETKKRTPFLGEIPILGYVFRKSEMTNEKTDLIIFITPHIITPEM
ncbi:MAG TPA: type IV pilus secretin PilQ [Candidatus Omnitrophota bacterium]|nr:type IV pilus secretin PilQ [Candidatus Omnitrophota bacterium]